MIVFSSLYLEYLQSFFPTKNFVIEPNEFAQSIMSDKRGWVDAVNKFREKFTDSRIFVWQFEEIIEDKSPFFQGILGPDIDPEDLSLPEKAQSGDTTSEAAENILKLAKHQGPKKETERRSDIQKKFKGGTKFSLWTDEQKKIMAENMNGIWI